MAPVSHLFRDCSQRSIPNTIVSKHTNVSGSKPIEDCLRLRFTRDSAATGSGWKERMNETPISRFFFRCCKTVVVLGAALAGVAYFLTQGNYPEGILVVLMVLAGVAFLCLVCGIVASIWET